MIIVVIVIMWNPIVQAMWTRRFKIFNARKIADYTWEFPCDGYNIILCYEFRWATGSWHWTEVWLSISGGNYTGSFVARRQEGFDTVATAMKINKAQQINDSDLGGRVYVECEDELFVRALMSNMDVRAALKNYLDIFPCLRIEGGRCAFVQATFTLWWYWFKPEEVMTAARALVTVTRAVQRIVDSRL